MSKYDVIIAGSGLGGLECGAILSKEGYNVCVLEKNPLFGGCLQTFKKKGFALDTGIHYVGSMDDGQILNQYFKYFGILDHLKMRRLDEDAYDIVNYLGQEYKYAIGHQHFEEHLAQYFPQERDALKKYVTSLQEVGNLISVDKLKKGIISGEGMRFFSSSAAQQIESMTDNRHLRAILGATAPLYGGIRNESSWYHHAMINNSYIESAYRFVDGSMQVAQQLVRVISENGGTVLKNREVTRFVVENDHIVAVEVNNNERIEGSFFISNIHPKRTLELVDKSKLIKKAYISRISNLKNTYGLFTLYLIMKPKSLPYHNHNYFIHDREDVWFTPEVNKSGMRQIFISSQASSNDENYSSVVTLLAPMLMSELEKWKDTSLGARSASYEEFKEEKTKQLLDLLAKKYPEFIPHIDFTIATTPLSYRDYTSSHDGSAYGIVKDFHYPQLSFISSKTKIKNLFLTGQNLNVHGALGVTLTAMVTCSEFVGKEYLAKKVGNA